MRGGGPQSKKSGVGCGERHKCTILTALFFKTACAELPCTAAHRGGACPRPTDVLTVGGWGADGQGVQCDRHTGLTATWITVAAQCASPTLPRLAPTAPTWRPCIPYPLGRGHTEGGHGRRPPMAHLASVSASVRAYRPWWTSPVALFSLASIKKTPNIKTNETKRKSR